MGNCASDESMPRHVSSFRRDKSFDPKSPKHLEHVETYHHRDLDGDRKRLDKNRPAPIGSPETPALKP